jgi:hypothetical protein
MSKVAVSMRDFRRGDEGSTKMSGNNRFPYCRPYRKAVSRLCSPHMEDRTNHWWKQENLA